MSDRWQLMEKLLTGYSELCAKREEALKTVSALELQISMIKQQLIQLFQEHYNDELFLSMVEEAIKKEKKHD